MNKASLRQRRPVLESLEGRLVLSATAHAGGIGHAHVHHLASSRQSGNPVIVRLSPNNPNVDVTYANFSRRTKVITIEGTVVVPNPQYYYYYYYYSSPPSVPLSATLTNVSTNVSQSVSRRESVSGNATTEDLFSQVGQKVPFTIRLVADAGRFAGRRAIVSLYASFHPADSNTYYAYYPSLSAKMVIRLSNHRNA
ncbi:MAG: hypothetical protein ABS79_03880 [Planctomycetes bacterium SCN 63-9]|nr:MAG: hypothetical protein ABS79_03880 [Planctomycetes bacterium SCN 63-9]